MHEEHVGKNVYSIELVLALQHLNVASHDFAAIELIFIGQCVVGK